MCHEVAEYNTYMRYLMSIVVFGHFQRPSVVSNMKVSEFVRATKSSDGRYVILVTEHKTAASRSASLAQEGEHHKLFQLFPKRSVYT